jgi:hypothetical protein
MCSHFGNGIALNSPMYFSTLLNGMIFGVIFGPLHSQQWAHFKLHQFVFLIAKLILLQISIVRFYLLL